MWTHEIPGRDWIVRSRRCVDPKQCSLSRLYFVLCFTGLSPLVPDDSQEITPPEGGLFLRGSRGLGLKGVSSKINVHSYRADARVLRDGFPRGHLISIGVDEILGPGKA